MTGKMFAAIDVGSFDSELAIYQISKKGEFHRVDSLRSQLPIGRDTYNTGMISNDMTREIISVLGRFRDVIKSYGIEDYAAYASSALRDAGNASVVLDQIRVRTGIRIRTGSNSELRFMLLKAVAAFGGEFDEVIKSDTAVLDIGYGSSQISIFRGGVLSSTENLALGVLRMSEMAARWKAGSQEAAGAIREMILGELETWRMLHLQDGGIRTLVVTGEGLNYMTIRGLGGKKQRHFPAEEFGAFCRELGDMPPRRVEERFNVAGTFADVLIPCAQICAHVLEMSGAGDVWTPGTTLCDGIAAEYAESNHFAIYKHDFEEDIFAAAHGLAGYYRCQMPHVEQVEMLALRIFDAMKQVHGMTGRERLLLRIAATLHDCGKYVSLARGPQNSYRIILSTELIGLSHLEREMIANIVRFNAMDFEYDEIRLESPLERYDNHAGRQRDIRITIAKLTAILRLATSLDRGHAGKLKDLKVTVKDDRLMLRTAYAGNMVLEEYALMQKADFFDEIFGMRPELRRRRG